MANAPSVAPAGALRLQRPIDPASDRLRGGTAGDDVVSLVLFGDFLCPYCRNLRHVLARLRQVLGERFAYVFRHFPNERAHPGAEFIARASEAAGMQGRFWEMHDRLYEEEPPIPEARLLEIAESLGLDLQRLRRDLDSESVRRRVEEDLAGGRRHGG